jgi:hypothetical protein
MDSKSNTTSLNLNYKGPLPKFKADNFQGQYRPIPGPTFLDGDKRLNSTISPEERSGISKGCGSLYYCLRCMRAFPVAYFCGAVIELDKNGNPIQDNRAVKTLAPSDYVPCPALSRLFGHEPETGVISRWKSFRTRFSGLLSTFGPIWKRSAGTDPCAFVGQSIEAKRLANRKSDVSFSTALDHHPLN